MNPAVATSGPPEIAWPAIAAVILLSTAAAAVHWWLRRRGLIPSATSPIKLIATRSLGGKRSVAVIEVETHRFLLGLTDEAVSLLSQLPSEAKATSPGTVVSLPALGAAR
jgi:flagellar biogenesis protein FliO